MSGTIDKGALPVSIGEAQAFVRVETGEEEALLAALVRTASAVCEQFIGQWIMDRAFEAIVASSGDWVRLAVTPVNAITDVAAVLPDGTRQALAFGSYEVDIDADGVGYVRLPSGGSAQRLAVAGRAGMAAEQNEVPEPLRQGILRLTAHFFAHRDADDTPPAAVTALWKPYRPVRL
ncbi:hypothetical protein WJT74_01870 [Sphingomicrobium sp. XHP0239]|uniref:head-tail connector protein n=1 Tax=Sphingomicrobium maritimum TaxID=3133972 RepID=UPI0031CC7A5A